MDGKTIPERGEVRSCEPFTFWWAPTICLEQLIVSGTVSASECRNLLMVVGQLLITHPLLRYVFSS